MKTIKLILFVSFISFISQSCYKNGGPWGIKGKGSNVEETRHVTGFNRIDLSVDADISYTQDSVYKLEVSGQANILNILETKVVGTELVFDFKRNTWDHNKIKITVHSPDMKSIDLSGSGDIHVENQINTNDLELLISGSGNISVPRVNVKNLAAKVSGSGNINISGGTIMNENFTISGSGDIDAMDAVSSTNISKISGSGNIDVHVTESLNVDISGSGDVRYRGRPAIDSEISGSGRLIHID